MSAHMRKETINYVKNNIENIPDEDIINLYRKIINIVNININDNTIDRIAQINCIENNLKYMNNENLNEIKNTIETCLTREESQNDKMKRIALELINKLLVAMGKPLISDLCEFTNVYREEIIKEKYKDIINNNLKYIFQNGYSKHTCMIYQKKSIKNYHLSVLKGMLKTIGYELLPKKKNKTINGEKIVLTFYCIQKKQLENELEIH
jgi:hypothetical protein